MTRLLLGLGLTILTLFTAHAPASAQSYRIKAGDTLQVEVVEDASLNRSVLVLPDGRVTMPQAGSVIAAGRTVEQVQAALASKLTPSFATRPNVYVSVGRLAEAQAPTGPAAPKTIDVFVLGEAKKPGKFEVERGTTVLQLFSQMGGFTSFAATKRIQLRRTDAKTGVERIVQLNYKAIMDGTSRSGQMSVGEGDVILIPQRRLFE
ncbi:MAG: polysaccharide biosynthesis/export family protein [Pseudooceanicola sp.]